MSMQGTIETIAFGGQGILRDQGYVVFIPFTAPGDNIHYELVHKKKKHGEGKSLQIAHPSPLRTQPLCPSFGICGGCQFQHLSYAAQLEVKRKFIEDALQRLAMTTISIGPVIPSQEIWAYRNNIRLGIHSQTAGYVGHHHSDIIEVKECPIFADQQDSILQDLQHFLSLSSVEAPSSVRIFKQKDGYLLLFQFPQNIPESLIQLAHTALSTYSSWKGIILSTHRKSIEIGDVTCQLDIFDLKLRFSPFGFIQNHAEQSRNIYSYILEHIPETVTRALDLYCGIGITSLLMAKRGIETLGIESHIETVKIAKQNAIDNGIKNVTYHCGKAELLVSDLLKQAPCDIALLNPPRTGLDQAVISELIARPLSRLIYVSCMPPTLARDLRLLLEGGYQIEKVQGFDMFPQTTHVETVVILIHQNSRSVC